MTVKVQMTVEPPSGTVHTAFDLTWGAVIAPNDFEYVVKYKPPGASKWLKFGSDASQPMEYGWTPNQGPGTYQFRARYQNTHFSGQPHSRWSPIVTVTVTS